ncbi:MAG: hypothetical protein ACYTG7_15695 [Planctomycetota bacterium]
MRLALIIAVLLIIPASSFLEAVGQPDGSANTPALATDVSTLSERTGGIVNFYLFGGAPNGGRDYILLGSMSGTYPGTPLPGGLVTLPLNWDAFTDTVISLINTPVFESFMGFLTWGSSSGWAELDTQGPLPPGYVGTKVYFAYCLYNPFDFVSNAVEIEIVP